MYVLEQMQWVNDEKKKSQKYSLIFLFWFSYSHTHTQKKIPLLYTLTDIKDTNMDGGLLF